MKKPMRQNFLSREVFVEATELQAKESLLSIPVFASNISLLKEDAKLHSHRFSYSVPQKAVEYRVDVSVLPLNNHYSRISLHATHLNEEAFDHDTDMAVALHDFESAILAAVKGDSSLYKPYQPKEKKSKKLIQLAATMVASAGVFFLKKKLS